MKFLLLTILIFSCNLSWANLYLQTEYQEGSKPKIVTKHHIFLNKRYPIYYSRKSYVLILKKIIGNEATIESESYDLDKIGHKTMHGGGLGTYKVGKSFSLIDYAPNGGQLYSLKIDLEKIVEMKP
ncbi:MAG: hypothetical protein Q7U04_06365 [Bacteriovorax sp.]|nr:hypothetical protein [Bacteriovorax sp.]